MRQSVTAAGALVAGLVVGGAIVVGAAGSGEVIHACVDDKTGEVRIAASPDECRTDKKESPLTWNVEGPQGVPGPQGIPGAQGVPGQDGQDGQDGADGNDGAPGTPGADGQDGADGEPCTVTDDGEGTITLTCPDGSTASWAGTTTLPSIELTAQEQALATTCNNFFGSFEGPVSVGVEVRYTCDDLVLSENESSFEAEWTENCLAFAVSVYVSETVASCRDI